MSFSALTQVESTIVTASHAEASAAFVRALQSAGGEVSLRTKSLLCGQDIPNHILISNRHTIVSLRATEGCYMLSRCPDANNLIIKIRVAEQATAQARGSNELIHS
jgi:hypothetical protein